MKTICTIFILITVIYSIDAQQFSVEPEQLHFKTEPGKWDKLFLKITNQSDKKKNYKIVIKDYTFDQGGEKKYLNPGVSTHSCSDWIKIIPDSFTLAPFEYTDIAVLMKVPKNENSASSKWSLIIIQELYDKYTVARGDRSTVPELSELHSKEVHIFKACNNENQTWAEIDSIMIMPDDKSVAVILRNTGENILSGKATVHVLHREFDLEMHGEVKEIALYPALSGILIFHLPMQLKKGINEITVFFDYCEEHDVLKKLLEFEKK